MRNPVFLDSILVGLWNITSFFIPTPLLTMATILGGTAAICALFCIGMILTAQLSSSEGFVAGWFIQHLPVHILKLAIQPLITYCCFTLLGLNSKLVGVIVLIVAMPKDIIAYIIAEKYYVYT